VVKLSDNSRTAVVLANSESDKKTSARGVGRVWCTWRDWSAFSVLPVGLLEEILVGQTFELFTVLGAVRRGTVVGREVRTKGGGGRSSSMSMERPEEGCGAARREEALGEKELRWERAQ
jgi:hypothetical protein